MESNDLKVRVEALEAALADYAMRFGRSDRARRLLTVQCDLRARHVSRMSRSASEPGGEDRKEPVQ